MRADAQETLEPTEDALALMQDGGVSVSTASRETTVSRSMLYQMMMDGRLPYCQIGRKRIIPRRALATLLAKSLIGGSSRAK